MTMTVGNKIRAARKEKALTQDALGERCGMSGSMVRQYELGIKNPKLVTLKKFAKALGVNTQYFLDIETNELTPLEKLIGSDLRQIQIYAKYFEMNVPEFMIMVLKQGIENAKGKLLGKEPHIVHALLDELKALDSDENPSIREFAEVRG
jgi:transcriptional regulator with XRE-family HTH domain